MSKINCTFALYLILHQFFKSSLLQFNNSVEYFIYTYLNSVYQFLFH